MQTVTQEFKDAHIAMPSRVATFRVEMKRRFFNGSAFVLEASPIVFNEIDISKISSINWKLDSVKQNRILASNVTLRMNNKDWQWMETNLTDGLFKPDAVATQGYDPYKTEFTIFYGYELQDGTFETIPLFTGEAVNYLFDTNNKTVEIQVTGRELKLQTSDAQRVATFVNDLATTPATGDNINTDFLAEESTWVVDKVRENTVAAIQGDLGYKVEDINDAEIKTKIKFGVAPEAGVAVDWSGRQWLRDKKISTLVGLLCDEANIPPGERDIAEPLYPGVASFKDIDSQADWEAALLLQNLTTTETPGDITQRWYLLDDFADGDFTANPAWTLAVLTGQASAAVVGNRLKTAVGPNTGQVFMSVPQPQAFGTWEFQLEHVSSSSFGSVAEPFNFFKFISSDFTVFANGYGFEIDVVNQGFSFNRYDGLIRVSLIELGVINNVDILWRVTRSLSGEFKIYKDDVLVGTVTDNTYGSSGHLTLSNRHVLAQSTVTQWDLDSFHWSPEVIVPPSSVVVSQALFESEVFDLLAPPDDWGSLTFTHLLGGGTIVYETAVASSGGGPFDAFVGLGDGDIIQSALKQFIKVRATITPSSQFPPLTPRIERIVINFSATSLFIAHADFKDKNCFAAIQRLAEISNSEFGFNGAGRFFFRQKNVDPTPLLNLDQSNVIQKIGTFNAGYSKVINSAQVTYDPYYKEIDSITESEPSPTSIERFGKKISSLTINDFLFSNNADFSEAIAKLIFESGFKPRRNFRMVCRIIPQLELSDVILVSFHDSPLIAENILGDFFQIGFPALADNTNTIARSILVKVVGITFDFVKAKSTLEVEEVL